MREVAPVRSGTGLAATRIDPVRHPEQLSADWLTAVLRASGAAGDTAVVARFEAAAIGTGQMSESYRVVLTWDDGAPAGPDSVVVKLAASDPTSRSTGIGLGIYEREIRFYRDVAPRDRKSTRLNSSH